MPVLKNQTMLSLQLDIRTRRIVIVGGGKVATRKAALLIAAGATDITAIAPAFAEGFPPTIKRVGGAYTPSVLAGAALVFAATDRAEVNDAVVRDARAVGALVNRADADGDLPGDFTLPAKVDFGDIRVTVSAGSAALSAAIREKLIHGFDPHWASLAAAMKTLRPWVVGQSHLTAEERAAIFRELASDEALEVSAGGVEMLIGWIRDRHEKLLVPSAGIPGEG